MSFKRSGLKKICFFYIIEKNEVRGFIPPPTLRPQKRFFMCAFPKAFGEGSNHTQKMVCLPPQPHLRATKWATKALVELGVPLVVEPYNTLCACVFPHSHTSGLKQLLVFCIFHQSYVHRWSHKSIALSI